MVKKDIKAIVTKQLKSQYPGWKRLPKKQKRKIANEVLDTVVEGYDFKQDIKNSLEELLGINNQQITQGIMTIEEMGSYIENYHKAKFFNTRNFQHPAIKDKELKFIDEILDNEIINKLLSYDGYTPALRDFLPSTFLRAEILKALRYPEISYRKFCGDDKHYEGYKRHNDYTGLEQKQNRAFIGLPLNSSQMLFHSQLSLFRSSLTFQQLANLTVFTLYHFQKRGFLSKDDIHCVDSTELAIDCQELLAKFEVNGKHVRIYTDLDSDCGKRRKKQDKSVYVVGYRMHTLTAINSETGQSYPLISLFAPANRHDSNFLAPLIKFGEAIGLELRFITADEAYSDKNGAIYDETGVTLIRPPSDKVKSPENVDTTNMLINLDDLCEVPMEYLGIDDNQHEFRCATGYGECPRSESCPRYRTIPIDNGYFQRIIYNSQEVQKALDIRKNGERPFNLIKKREGLDHVRVRSQSGVIARSVFSTMATLLVEMAGTRKKIKRNQQKQLEFPMAA